jgi:hypothetical protein
LRSQICGCIAAACDCCALLLLLTCAANILLLRLLLLLVSHCCILAFASRRSSRCCKQTLKACCCCRQAGTAAGGWAACSCRRSRLLWRLALLLFAEKRFQLCYIILAPGTLPIPFIPAAATAAAATAAAAAAVVRVLSWAVRVQANSSKPLAGRLLLEPWRHMSVHSGVKQLPKAGWIRIEQRVDLVDNDSAQVLRHMKHEQDVSGREYINGVSTAVHQRCEQPPCNSCCGWCKVLLIEATWQNNGNIQRQNPPRNLLNACKCLAGP